MRSGTKLMTNAPRRRGRPRAYDPDRALTQVIECFWKTGYSGTSLDDISAATGMNRPSLYAAFGDKQALYLKALRHYWSMSYVAMREALVDVIPLDEALMRVYEKALAIYFSGNGRPRGCFAIGTATTEAVENAEIRDSLAKGLHALDKGFEARIRTAHSNGELNANADPVALSLLASATLHTIAIRARAGSPRAELRRLARNAVGVICGIHASSR
jgi:TetR/AcrR family transcriptional regulator, copper-responsive repressor